MKQNPFGEIRMRNILIHPSSDKLRCLCSTGNLLKYTNKPEPDTVGYVLLCLSDL